MYILYEENSFLVLCILRKQCINKSITIIDIKFCKVELISFFCQVFSRNLDIKQLIQSGNHYIST